MAKQNAGLDLKAMIAQAVAEAMGKAPTSPAPQPAPMATPAPLQFRVSEKGAISVYGLGRFPFSAYENQWDRLISQVLDLKRFVEANRNDPRVVAARKSRS